MKALPPLTLVPPYTPSKMPFSQNDIQQIALQRFLHEEAERKAAQERALKEIAAAEAAMQEAQRLARIRAEQEREEARIRAERAIAEEKVREEAAALEAAVEAELIRLRNRTELEVLRDEVADLKKQLSEVKITKTANVCTQAVPAIREKELWLIYRDYTTGKPTEHQRKFTENCEVILQAINMEIVSAIWRGKVFGGRIEGFGPRSVPLLQDNPYNKTWNPICPLGEIDVSNEIHSLIRICSWH